MQDSVVLRKFVRTAVTDAKALAVLNVAHLKLLASLCCDEKATHEALAMVSEGRALTTATFHTFLPQAM